MHRRAKKIILELSEIGEALKGTEINEVIVALSPSFGKQQTETMAGVPHGIVLREIAAGIEEEGLRARIIKFYHSSDLASFAREGSRLSGSGVSVGIQSKGTTVIHQKDLALLDNLELFPQAPLYDAKIYRLIGINAARYSKGDIPNPVPTLNDQMVLSKFQIKAALLHIKDSECIICKKMPVELSFTVKEE